MERPENRINPKDYDKPISFERDWDAEIFYSYIDAQKYIDYLENEVKKLRLGIVVGQSEQLKNAEQEGYKMGWEEGAQYGYSAACEGR